ncbi:MAG TPA: phosphotransferase family protein [Mycobacteriales bacterium]|nr:phosphotransferase family protein [Mycobacteriales bacterium]
MTEPIRMQRSSRDPAETQQRLERWLADVLGAGSQPRIRDLAGTDANGMSSDTVLFSASWQEDGKQHDERLVARLAPTEADVPVFETYNLAAQYDAIRQVADLTQVPVPRVWWCETSPQPLGTPFFVMSRVDGIVPPDVMPYTFGDNWLYDASPEEQRKLQESTIEQIAALHRIDNPTQRFPFLERTAPGDSHLRRHVAHTKAWYDMVAREGAPSALVENTFAWLEDHWPAHESAPVFSWGDSRIGNVLYQDFEPVALLDWEMAGLGPAELDIAWIIYAHRVFEDIAAVFELRGMPGFMTAADVASQYEKLTGYAIRNLRFYMVYCALQWAVVFLRTGARAVHFGEQEMPADTTEFIRNSMHFEALLDDVDND